MKAMLILTFIMADGTWVDQKPIPVKTFQLCLDMMMYAIKKPIDVRLASRGVVEISGSCEYAKPDIPPPNA